MTRVENYELLLEKLKPKKPTDECHTLHNIYDAFIEQLLVEYKQFHKQFVKRFFETLKQEAKKTTRTIQEVRISEMGFKAIEAGMFDFLILENRGFQRGDLIKLMANHVGALYEIIHVKTIKQPLCKLIIRRWDEEK